MSLVGNLDDLHGGMTRAHFFYGGTDRIYGGYSAR